ncbi:hypothetical protein ACVJBD_006531 [Rhizobium mongolense]
MVVPSSRAAIIRQSKASAPLKEPVRRRERFPSADEQQSCARSLPKESYTGRAGLRTASAVYDRLKREKHRQCRSDIIDPEDADRYEPRYSQPRARAHSCSSLRRTRQAARPACLCRAHSCFAAAYRSGLPPEKRGSARDPSARPRRVLRALLLGPGRGGLAKHPRSSAENWTRYRQSTLRIPKACGASELSLALHSVLEKHLEFDRSLCHLIDRFFIMGDHDV